MSTILLTPTGFMPRGKDPEVDTCTKCGCTWFEQVPVQQYKSGFTLVLGQKPQPETDLTFWFLRCLVCQTVKELPMQPITNKPIKEVYDKLLDLVEKK